MAILPSQSRHLITTRLCRVPAPCPPQGKRVYVGTDERVVAALNSRLGTIEWRTVLPPGQSAITICPSMYALCPCYLALGCRSWGPSRGVLLCTRGSSPSHDRMDDNMVAMPFCHLGWRVSLTDVSLLWGLGGGWGAGESVDKLALVSGGKLVVTASGWVLSPRRGRRGGGQGASATCQALLSPSLALCWVIFSTD
jgi:hypothetical protein